MNMVGEVAEQLSPANLASVKQFIDGINDLLKQTTREQGTAVLLILNQLVERKARDLDKALAASLSDQKERNPPPTSGASQPTESVVNAPLKSRGRKKSSGTLNGDDLGQAPSPSTPALSAPRRRTASPPDDEEATAKVQTVQKTTQQVVLGDPSVVSSLEKGVSLPVGVAQRVYEDLMKINIGLARATKSGKRNMQFQEEDAQAIIRCVFHDIANLTGLERLNSLISEYAIQGEDEGDAGVVTRAFSMSESEEIPAEGRPVFLAYGQLQRSLAKEGARLKSFRTLMERVDLVEAYHNIIKCVDDREKEAGKYSDRLNRTFRQQGFVPSQGRAWNSCVIDWMAKHLKIDRTAVQERIHQSAGIHEMSRVFGYGCLTIVPENMTQLIMKWKIGKMEQVWPVIQKHFPVFQEMCVWLTEFIVRPIISGDKCSIRELDLDKNGKPMFERLIEAQRVVQVSEEEE